MPLLSVEELTVVYDGAHPDVRALDGVRLQMEPGESIGVLGESGSGKSTLASAILQFLPPGAVRSGRVLFRGQDLCRAGERELARVRGRHIAIVFQQPAAALNAFVAIDSQVADVAEAHGAGTRAESMRAARTVLSTTLGDEAARVASSYPH